MVDEPDSNRWPTACAAALPLSFRPLAEHLLPIPGMRYGSAARTGQAVLLHATCAAVDCSSDVPHWRLRCFAESANPCALHPARRPCRSIKARRIPAPARLSLTRASMPGCFGSAMHSRFLRVSIPLRTRKTKRPRVLEPEGVRVASGDRGDRSPRCAGISRWRWSRNNSACREAAARRAIRTRAGPHRGWAMTCRLRCGMRASWKFVVRSHRRSAKVAHLTRVFSVWQQIFHIADEWQAFAVRAARRIPRRKRAPAPRPERNLTGGGDRDAR